MLENLEIIEKSSVQLPTNGKVTDATANVTNTKPEISADVAAKIVQAAGTDNVAITTEVTDAKGNTKYTVTVDAKNLTAGNTLKILAVDKETGEKKLVNATDVTDEIYQVVMELFGELWRGEPLRLLGVALSDVTKEPQEQISLFRDDKKEKARKLDAAMDQIRGRYGWDAVKRGK